MARTGNKHNMKRKCHRYTFFPQPLNLPKYRSRSPFMKRKYHRDTFFFSSPASLAKKTILPFDTLCDFLSQKGGWFRGNILHVWISHWYFVFRCTYFPLQTFFCSFFFFLRFRAHFLMSNKFFCLHSLIFHATQKIFLRSTLPKIQPNNPSLVCF